MIFTTIDKNFWHDGDVMSWTPEMKYFFIYLCTNPRASWCGIFEVPLRLMEVETGYNWETVQKLLKEFQAKGKLVYSEETREIAIINWLKYHKPDNANVIKAVKRTASTVKNKSLFHHVDGLAELLGITETPSEPIRNPLETVTEPLPSTNTKTDLKLIPTEEEGADSSESAARSKVKKLQYGSKGLVNLTEEEYQRLSKEFPGEYLDAIEAYDEWAFDNKARARKMDHNKAIRRWAIDAVLERRARKARLGLPPVKDLSKVAGFN